MHPSPPSNRARSRPLLRADACVVTAWLILAAPAALGTAPEPLPPDLGTTLCASDEKVYFHCALRGDDKLVSLCGSPDLHQDGAKLHYRFGRHGAVELDAPAADVTAPLSFFRYGGYSRAQVEQRTLSFRRGHYRYELFVSRDGEVNPPVVQSGIRVRRDTGHGKPAGKATILQCETAAFSLLSELRPLLKCDDDTTFGGCKAE